MARGRDGLGDLAFVPASVLFAYSVAVFVRRRTVPSVLHLFGAACLVVVVLTHIAEAFHVLPWMQWGEPHSAGHYVDLTSAVIGVTLLPVGWVSSSPREQRANSWNKPIRHLG